MMEEKQELLAWCNHCKKLQPINEIRKIIGQRNKAEYITGKCQICGNKTLVRTVKTTNENKPFPIKFNMDYLHYKVIHQRLKEISDSEGVTLSYLTQKAIEQYLYGESGSITDDPYFEKFIGENNITQA